MKVHYFVKDESNQRSHDMELVAWMEHENLYLGTNMQRMKFYNVEHIRLSIPKGSDYGVICFETTFGKNSCRVSLAKDSQDLIQDETKEDSFYPTAPLEHVTQQEYLDLRKKVLELYQKEMFLDFDKLNKE